MDPMIARPAAALPAGREWIYEARVQGRRALIYKDGAAISIRMRGEPDLESRYPEVTLAAAAVREEHALLDGVIVLEADATTHFYAMDVVWVDQRDLRAAHLSERRERLTNIIANSGLRPIQVFDGSMLDAVRTAQEIGLSGVVAKRIDSAYRSGVAHNEWRELRFFGSMRRRRR
jgi:bifunctional non-homologous end joining protein LigD